MITSFKFTSSKNLEEAICSEADRILKYNISHSFVVGVCKNGKCYIRGFGKPANHQTSEPPTQDTVFQMASLTKLFTIATLQILIDEGLFQIEDRLDQLIGDSIPLSPATSKITLLQLATHTSGLPAIPKSFQKYVQDEKNPYKWISRDNVFSYLADPDDMQRPGKMIYSNYGAGLLGHVMELIMDRNLGALMRDKLLKPLKLENIGFVVARNDLKKLATGHTQDNEVAPVWEFNALGGAGGLFGCAADLMRFACANFSDDTPVGKSLANMRQSRSSPSGLLAWHRPFALERCLGNRNIIWHNGQVGGFASYLSVDVRRKIIVLILSGKSIDLTMPGSMMMRRAQKHDWKDKDPGPN